ncbi:adenylate/guanylate cyclase [Planoprotostelium fungivorum]|uniref:Adenylate/guanylate cyclase n=1 Tax=Planoprotostelium fungivorum TaxID=1890364 RepID=A0A2P6MWS0_9EUKA|nr:adenylate/guanylate cyclase [Planoprotostelium fungivorum]
MVHLSKVVPFEDEPESSAHSVSPIDIPSTFSSAVSFGSHYRGKRWKDRLSSLVSIRSIYIAMTLGLVISVTAIIAPLSVVSQQRLILDGLNDRANTNILLTNAAVVSLLSQSSDLLKTMSTAYTSFRFQPLHLNESYPVPLPENYMFWMDIAQSAVLQANSPNLFTVCFPDGKLAAIVWGVGRPILFAVTYPAPNDTVVGSLWVTNGTSLPLADLNFESHSFLFNDTSQVKGQRYSIYIGDHPPCNTTFQVSDILQSAGIGVIPVETYAVSYAVCDSAGNALAGIYTSFPTTAITDILNSTEVGVLSLIINQEKMLVATSNGDSASVDPNTFSARLFAPNSTVEWISKASAATPIDTTSSSFITIDGNHYLIKSIPMVGVQFNKWILIKLYPMASVEAIQRQYVISVVAVLVVLLIVCVAVVLILAYWMTKPLKNLSEELKHVARMELDLRQLSTPRFYEAKLLQSSFMQLHTALKSFRKFVPNQVILNILKYNREASSHLSPAKVTVMFQDIQGFTSLAETMQPMQLAGLTEEYLEAMTFIISQHGGTVDKYIGGSSQPSSCSVSSGSGLHERAETANRSFGLIIFSITKILNTTEDGVLSLIVNEDKMLVATCNGDSPFLNASTFSPRVFAPNSTVTWIAQAAAVITVSATSSTLISIKDQNYLLMAIPIVGIPFTRWTLIKLYPLAKEEEIQRRYVITVVIVLVMIVIITVVIAIVVAYCMTKPLKNLSEELSRVARMELDLKQLSTPRFYEAKLLQASFMQLHTALKSFRKFVPNQVILNILKYNREASSHLSPAKVTVMFQDIQGFTSLAETMQPMQLAGLTEEYLEAMTFIISQHSGTVDKYIGDCIMSIYNKPESLPNHPTVACQVALACLRELKQLNKRWKDKYGVQLHTRIGIHTGEVLVGNMGSDVRMNYTVIGDNVNIAARLEGINKKLLTNDFQKNVCHDDWGALEMIEQMVELVPRRDWDP